jgi:hypothetical protein
MANWEESDAKPIDLMAVLKEGFTFSAAASTGLELVGAQRLRQKMGA